jgi:hypothetical protein
MAFETDLPLISDETAPQVRGRWDFLFSWTGLFIVGWVIYELTAQTALAITLFCCKFGWEDVRTGTWLRRRDPLKARGKMEFWIFVASGLWKITLTAMIFMVVAVSLVEMAKQPQPANANGEPPAEFIEACATAMIGVLLSCVATCRSLGLAVWHKQRIWLDGSLHQVRRRNDWPPRLSAGENKAGTLLKVAVAIVSVIPILTAIIAFVPMRPVQARQSDDAVVFSMLALLIGVPIVLFVAASYLKDKFLATRSDQCWPPSLSYQEVLQ